MAKLLSPFQRRSTHLESPNSIQTSSFPLQLPTSLPPAPITPSDRPIRLIKDPGGEHDPEPVEERKIDPAGRTEEVRKGSAGHAS